MKRLLTLILCCTLLVGCSPSEGSADVSLPDDMTTDEAIKYARKLLKDNVGDSSNGKELLDNMINDAVNDFTSGEVTGSYVEESSSSVD